jgi:hypothetical protein
LLGFLNTGMGMPPVVVGLSSGFSLYAVVHSAISAHLHALGNGPRAIPHRRAHHHRFTTASIQALPPRLPLIARDHLSYEATIDDPRTWTRPWSVAFPRTRDERYPWFEYACHEGNYSLPNILRGSRAGETRTSN